MWAFVQRVPPGDGIVTLGRPAFAGVFRYFLFILNVAAICAGS